MTDAPRRAPHAALGRAGRWAKARKIHALVAPHLPQRDPLRLLEIGTGSGVIAHYFACHAGIPAVVDAVDVEDQRIETDGYRFQRVGGTALPFAPRSFDLVISNHVIEHVGEAAAQIDHLRQIARVLDDGGVAYLATPSRWQLVEPHFKLAFLSWLPERWRTPYLRLCRRGQFYDCTPRSLAQLVRMLDAAGLAHCNQFESAVRQMAAQERKGLVLALAARLPGKLLQRLASLSPTHVFVLSTAR